MASSLKDFTLKESDRIERVKGYLRSFREGTVDGRVCYQFSRTLKGLARRASSQGLEQWLSWCQECEDLLDGARRERQPADAESMRELAESFETLLRSTQKMESSEGARAEKEKNEGSSLGAVVQSEREDDLKYLASLAPGEGTDSPTSQLNDLIARLLQVSEEDLSMIESLRFEILALARSEGYSSAIRTLAAEAMLALDELLYGDQKEVESKLNEAVKFLEEAIRQLGTDGGCPSASREEVTDTPSAEAERLTPASPQEIESRNFSLEAEVSLSERDARRVRPSEPFPASLPSDADLDLMDDFISECQECLDQAEAALLSLETNPDDLESVNTVFRSFHTIKGTSAFLGLSPISTLAHEAEDLLSDVRDRKIRYGSLLADLCLRSLDMMKALLAEVQRAVQGGIMSKPDGYDSLLAAFRLEGAKGLENSSASEDVVTEPVRLAAPELPSEESESTGSEGAGELLSSGEHSGSVRADKSATETLRVRTERLDRLIDMVGELVIAQSMLAQDESVLDIKNQRLARKVAHSGKIVRELQDLSMSMRMVPLRSTFQKMARLVRDLARKNQKEVDFITEGEETEIDRHMVEFIRDPLVHLLRNALDHGIETPPEREARGKRRQGTVRISAHHSGGNVVVRIEDDGRGLDRVRILQKALQSGLLEADNGQSDNEVFNLIFRAGFSTVEKVTEISGRGVGMDVVKKNIEALRGKVEVSSETGVGTCFTLVLPLTMAITDGMLVRVGAERYIIPISSIQLSFQPEESQLSSVTGKGEMVILRGELMPIFRFHRLFGVQGAVEDPTRGLLVVVSDGERRCALLVDELLEQQQVVAKSLGKGIGKVKGISGGAILGDGRVGLILDATEILELAREADYGLRIESTERLLTT